MITQISPIQIVHYQVKVLSVLKSMHHVDQKRVGKFG